jgi:catechol 2,3-dioxygenase-like lactoylglutathione lyase family enzyme
MGPADSTGKSSVTYSPGGTRSSAWSARRRPLNPREMIGTRTPCHSGHVFDHVTLRASDREASERFYLTVLPTIGIDQRWSDEHYAEWDEFGLMQAEDPSRVTRGLHIGFVARSREDVDEFWRVGTEAGYRDDGAPGPRPQYREDYYGAFLVDPDGNSAEAVHHGAMREGGWIDHLWIRVADVAASKRFYELAAPHAGLRLRADTPERAQFTGTSGSFSVVAGEPTEHLHMAFPAADNAVVDAFHRTLIEAGYRDNGPPGERPMYHPGYYGAYVLDPDGNNIELVSHNRGNEQASAA